MSIYSVLKSFLYRTTYLEHIVDKVKYPSIAKSYAGGSLATSNILIVTNRPIDNKLIEEYFSIEQVNYSVILISDLLLNVDIIKAEDGLIGPFTHIVNFFCQDNSRTSQNQDSQYNNDSFYKIYQWQQIEVDYLVKINQYSTICTCYIYNDSILGYVEKRHAEMCIRGLASVLSNHGIVCNGMVANANIPFDILLKSSIFMSSKYGQIMSGEVLDLIV